MGQLVLSLLYAGYYALTFGRHTKRRAADIISAVRPAVEWPYCFLCNTFDNVQIKIHQNARRLSSDVITLGVQCAVLVPVD